MNSVSFAAAVWPRN